MASSLTLASRSVAPAQVHRLSVASHAESEPGVSRCSHISLSSMPLPASQPKKLCSKREVGIGRSSFQGQRLNLVASIWRPVRSQRRSYVSASPVAQGASDERTYVMIKPDGVQRGLVGEIISRFERKGFILKGLKLFQCSKELAEEHYKDLKEKPFFPKLVTYIISGPVVAMIWEGPGSVASARKLIGATNPLVAEPGTIRGDLAVEVGRNVVHGSDSPENAEREIGLWFKELEMCEWMPELTPWLRE